MKKKIVAAFLGVLLIGILGTAVVSAVTADDAKANSGWGSGCRNGWGARNMGSAYCAGACPSCPYLNSGETMELKIETVGEALDIARSKIDKDISEEDISQMGRWWLVTYKNESGVSSQARIDAVTGEVFTFTADSLPAGSCGRGMCGQGCGRGSRFCRANSYN